VQKIMLQLPLLFHHLPCKHCIFLGKWYQSVLGGKWLTVRTSTSSLRRTNRLIYSIGGWKSNFRGFGCLLVLGLATGILGAIFSAVPFVGTLVGTLLASLTLVQLSTAWVHIVISTPSNKSFRGRMLPFKRVFEATSVPILISWVAMSISQWTPLLLSWALGLKIWKIDQDTAPPEFHQSDIWKSLVVILVGLVLNIVLVLPAHVLLVRVRMLKAPPPLLPCPSQQC
jgi:hypothetical protein